MAIEHAKRKRIGTELIEWIYLGIRTGARVAVAEYHSLKVSNPGLAEAHLRYAATLPVRARARINEARRLYEIRFGVNTFNTFIGNCLSLAGTVTLAELNAELTLLENGTATLRAMHAGGSTLDEIAAWIETNWEYERQDWLFPIPATYVDSWT